MFPPVPLLLWLISLLSVGIFQTLHSEEMSYQYLQDATYLSSNLIRALGYSSGNIQKIGILTAWPPCHHPHYIFMTSLSYTNELHVGQVVSMENWQKFEYFNLNISALLSDLITNKVASCSY